MNRVQKIVLTIFFIGIGFFSLFAEDVRFEYKGSGSYIYIERTDLRRYDNGKYTGLVSREIRSYMSPMDSPKGANPSDRFYDGNFYVAEGTMRARQSVGQEINNSISSTFKITNEGELIMIKDNGYPTFRSFPAFTKQKIKFGDKWQAKAQRVVDPLKKGVQTKIPMYVEYVYLRDDVFHGEEVFVLSAQWATRYGLASTLDFGGDRELKFAQGSHKANILVSKVTGNALVVRDTVDEEFQYLDGTKVAFKGTISMFTEYPPTYNKEKFFPALQRIASVSKEDLEKIMNKTQTDSLSMSEVTELGTDNDTDIETVKKYDDIKMGANKDSLIGADKKTKEVLTKDENRKTKNDIEKDSEYIDADENRLGTDIKDRRKESSVSKMQDVIRSSSGNKEEKIVVENTRAGIRLTMQNLQFKADSAELLSGENKRLDEIADLLKLVPEQMILIEGHTASVGNPKGEMQLSIERVNSIKQALIKRGIGADKFICKGSGGTKPIANNTTASGKAKNRRVEITILE